MKNFFVSDILSTIKNFCIEKGYSEIPTFDNIKGAGTFNPYMIESLIKKKDFKFFSDEFSYRINDSSNLINQKYCVRLSRHLQLQILDYPGKEDIIEFFSEILNILDIKKDKYIIEFLENNWTHETLGALGKGFEVMVCGLEVAQLTNFEYICGKKIDGGREIAIGIERLACIKQEVDSVFDLYWCENFKYKDFFLREERETLMEIDNLDKDKLKKEFDSQILNILDLIEKKMYIKAFREFSCVNHTLGKLEICSHEFQFKKRLYIEKLNSISKKIWNKISNEAN